MKIPDDKAYLADPWFHVCLSVALDTPALLKEFDRLSGTNLSGRGSPLDLMIDEATGRLKADAEQFLEFVRTSVYERAQRPAED